MSGDPAEYGPAHQPDRPTWLCEACGRPWPCEPGWEDLRERLPSGALGMFMVTMVGLAAGDMPESIPVALYIRFIEPIPRPPCLN